MLSWSESTFLAQAPDPCAPPLGNAIKCENALPGNPQSEWDVQGSGDASIQGFATDISVNRGETVQFKIATSASAYRLDIYRLGYYGGMGARKVATVLPSAPLPQFQPSCLQDFSTGLIDCGNWAVSASWTVPANATSGIYIAKAIRIDTGGASHIVFIVRNDTGHSDLLFQTSDTTWQAYNGYGGNSLYWGAPAGRAYKVSYNRPFATRDQEVPHNWLFWAEYPMVRFLEANGFDVSYFTDVDTDRRGAELLEHEVFMSVGHDEYWSAAQRTAVENARAAGVHLAFFSGNEIFRKVRWEPSIDGSGTPYRTLVAYKETLASAKIDPTPVWTGAWRDNRFSPPSDGGRPENALSGTIFMVNRGPGGDVGTAIQVPGEYGAHRFWRNTSISELGPGDVATLSNFTLGYEWDEDLDNGHRPAGLMRMSSTTEDVPEKVLDDYGLMGGPGTATHHLTLYRHSSGALVFGAGTIQWSFGLDSGHDGPATVADVRMQQATINLLADMGVQPTTLQAALVPATQSSDTVAPGSTILSPTAGESIQVGGSIVISGTAADSGGGVVGAVEVSVDGGQTWHPATGRETWSYVWTPTVAQNYTIAVRAVDDSGNLQAVPTTRNVVVTDSGAPTITARTPAPGATNVAVASAVTVTFNEAMSANTISGSTFELRTNGQLVPSTVTYSATTRTATLQPSALLNSMTTYQATVRGGASGVKDLAGNPLAGDSTWSFTTGAGPTCPCTIWDASAVPTVVDSQDVLAAELGVRFRPDANGVITAIRFYKAPANTGTHTVHLWSANGTLLGSGVATGETASGWQEVALDAPVNVFANTTYVASYHMPVGHYSYTANYFASGGVARTPLYAFGSGEGGNGVYKLGASGFPNQTDITANFWVDVVYVSSVAPDTTPPTITARTPSPNATNVASTSAVTVTFSEAMSANTFSGSTVELRTNGQLVPSTVTYSAATRTATLQPTSALSDTTTYQATVRGGASGVKDLAGNPLASDATWSFTTAAGPVCPCTIWDASAVPTVVDSQDVLAAELGVRFRPDANGVITAIRFYKAPANTGTHTVHLWSANGTLLGSGVATGETASGWQEVALDTPVNVLAGTTYVASYHMPVGHYSYTLNYFVSGGVARAPLYAFGSGEGGNGVYKLGASGFPDQTDITANFWVDVVYVSSLAPDTTPPTITTRTPSPNATDVASTSAVTVTFSEAMSASSITGGTVELRTNGQLVPSTVTYSAATRTATLQPTSALSATTTYQATVRGGASGVKDLAGNPLASDATWSFTTAAGPVCPCTIWDASAVPSVVDSQDALSVELGVRFRPTVNGTITAIRFYKAPANTGAHTVHLWSANGTLLGSGVATNETASGWQQVTLDTPVSVTANTTYVASYHTPAGRYSFNLNYFTSGVTREPLHAHASSDGGNGVYRIGASGFPDQTLSTVNFWVDVVFVTQP